MDMDIEREARISQMRADTDKLMAERLLLLTKETWWPRGMVFQAMTAAAALLTAGAILSKLFWK
jgi:hypothetical protein